MEVLRGMVVVEEARGKKQNDMQTNISRQNENSNERGKEEDEVLPFRGRGFLRVHGHERCLLAALWPRDHRRRRNGTESSFFPHTSCFFALLYHPRLCVWVKERRGLLPPLLLLLHVFFLLFLLFLPLCLMSSPFKEKKGWGTRLHRGRQKSSYCAVHSLCVSAYVPVCVCARVDRESSNVSQAPLLMSEPPSSLPFLPSFSSFTLPLSLSLSLL